MYINVLFTFLHLTPKTDGKIPMFFVYRGPKNGMNYMDMVHPTPRDPAKNKIWQIFDPGAGGPCRGEA